MKNTIAVFVSLFACNLVSAGDAPFYPSTTIEYTMPTIAGNECVERIDLPSSGSFQWISFQSTKKGSLAAFLSSVTYSGRNSTKSLNLPVVLRGDNGKTRRGYYTVTARVTAVKTGDADASHLTIGRFRAFDAGINAILLNIPELLNRMSNGVIDRYNHGVTSRLRYSNNKATLRVSQVHESRINSVLDIHVGAAAVGLAEYRCSDLEESQLDRLALGVSNYLTKVTAAFDSLATMPTPKSKRSFKKSNKPDLNERVER